MKIGNPPTGERGQFIRWVMRSKICKRDKSIRLVPRLRNGPGTIIFGLRTGWMVRKYIEPALVLLDGIRPIILFFVSAGDCQLHFRNRSRVRNHIHEAGEECSRSMWVPAITDGLTRQQHSPFSMKTVRIPSENSPKRVRGRDEVA